MSSSTHQIKVKAVDQTTQGFRSISNKAKQAGDSISKYVGAGIAAAGAYMGTQAIVGTINELGQLSDMSQRTGASVEDLTRTFNAFEILGLGKGSVEEFSKALVDMHKNTGRSGMEGFYATIEELQNIEDAGKRTQETLKIFGEESGVFLLPLVNGSKDSVEALKGVIDVVPGISSSVAKTGDEARDALSIATQGMKSVWSEGIIFMLEMFSGDFGGDMRESALSITNEVLYFFRNMTLKIASMWRSVTDFSERVGGAIGTFVGSLFNGASLSDAWDMTVDDWNSTGIGQEVLREQFDKKLDQRRKQYRDEYEKRKKEIENFSDNYESATKALSGSSTRTITESQGEKKKTESNRAENKNIIDTERKQKIQNDLIYGNTNEALKLAMLGPELNETKKQTKLLEDIAKNTKETNSSIKNENVNNGIYIKEIN